jgi:hypothetical protein
MKQFLSFLRGHKIIVVWLLLTLVGLGLLLHKLGSLTGGLSSSELAAGAAPVGWHGVYHQPLYLPLKIIRSVVFVIFPNHGQTLSRLPNVAMGALTIISFAWLIRLWHGTRVAVMATLLFACSAWTLHVSRLASFDVLYLWIIPTLFLTHALLKKYNERTWVWYGSLLVWGLLLYVPGAIWLIIADLYVQRQLILNGWRRFTAWWQRGLYVLAGLIWLPLLIIDFTRPHNLITWLGLPGHLAGPAKLLKQLVGVPVHLFIRGPEYPQLWLGRAPVLDIFTLAICLLGIYFYVRHWHATRSRLLGGFYIAGVILVGLGGPVSLSLLVPLLYIAAATGLAYLLHEWLRVFPFNPLARGLGAALIITAIGLSCLYNLRAYFVAWPHTATTRSTFHYRRQP